MKESISYAFLLNIVIIFIFTCAAIIMGVFSYYKAFKANSIIAETIEKYEGYNCLSKEEIATKLGNIGYNTPFKVSCNNRDGKCDDSEEGYKVISYNLDFNGNLVYDNEPMNSTYKCEVVNKQVETESGTQVIPTNNCTTNKHYQYGVYTYMYLELPVISSLVRIPVFSKTTIMYEFRNFYVENNGDNKSVTDVEQIFEQMYERSYKDGKLYITDAYYGKPTNISGDIKYDNKAMKVLGNEIFEAYTRLSTGKPVSFMNIIKDGSDNYRNDAYIEILKDRGHLDTSMASALLGYGLNGETYMRNCGYKFDYSKIK